MSRQVFLLLLLLGLASRAAADPRTAQPVVGRNADGYLEVFSVGPDGQLRHRWQRASNGDWSFWLSLGGPFLPGLAVATNRNGQLEVFAVERIRHTLRQITQTMPNSRDWTTWKDLGGPVGAPIAATHDLDGRLEVFAPDVQGSGVKHLWQTQEGSWSAWANLGGHIEPGLVATPNLDGRLELFGVERGTHELVHCWQRQTNSDSDWAPWASLGGSVLPGIAAGRNARGILEIFAVNRNSRAVQRITQRAPNASARWSDWVDFGGNFKDGLAVGQSADLRLDVMGVDTGDNMLMHRWETLVDGSDQWSAWSGLGQRAQPYCGVGQNEDGNLEVFAVDVNDPTVLNHRRQISKASEWLDWSSLDHQTFQYGSRLWQTDEGLPHNNVQAIAQTRDGYLWIGTQAGLARFDGVEFTPLNLGPLGPKSPSITALCADSQNALWIGAEGFGLLRYDAGVFSRFTTTNGLAGDDLRVIYRARDGALWIGTTTGMSCYRDGRFINYTTRQGLLSNIVRAINEDRDGNLWIATGAGLNRLRGGRMDSFPMPNGLPNDSARAICQDRGGRIWIGSNNGMLWYNGYWKSFYAYNTRYGLSDTFVSAICEDHEGNLWVGTYSGLNRFHEGRFFPQLNNEGAPFDKVNALFEDSQGNLWVGSHEGLVRLTPQRFVTYTQRQGLTHNNVMSVLEDRAGAVWLGTWGGGLDRLKDEKVTSYTATNVFSQELILSLCESRDGSLWVGEDFDGGLARLQNGVFRHYDMKEGLLPASVRVIYEDRSGRLWVGTSQGLCWLKDGGFITETNLAGKVVRAICQDTNGALWVGTESGLFERQQDHWIGFTKRDGLSNNEVTALLDDSGGSLWIGTADGGLNRYKSGAFKAYTTSQGLFSDEIFEILDDGHGWLWMSCSKGIFRVRKADLSALDSGALETISSVAYGKADGLESTQCSGIAKPGAWAAHDGRLWFATSKGVASVDPASIKINLVPPPVFIEQVLADRKVVQQKAKAPRRLSYPPNPTKTLSSPAVQPDPVVVPPGRGELEFRYTALDFQSPESTRFKYKLDGVDTDWIEAGARRMAHYNNVYPGDYIFRVIACNKDGIWNDAGAALAVVVRPHVWQTLWWRGMVVMVVIGGAGAAVRYITRRKMQRRMALLEQRNAIERERGRIAKDIHDDLGSSLTRIMMLGERAEEGLASQEDVGVHVAKIVTSARDTVQALDEIVWAVNPENDTLEGLIEYISHYADEFFEEAPISCRLEMPGALPECVLPAEVRHDLFLIVKEAFHNVLKHAAASQVWVQVSVNGSTLAVAIKDNGQGFSPGPSNNGRRGNGLHNMRRRMGGLGGTIEVRSAPGNGTEVRIALQLPKREGCERS
ncbi:MAG TPA: two-component regulator propeller domain-containing protein [Verrucomicrobiae bacterium]|nr:two-component regulator propeller domain-containing protein [Verrucomicrobiae bacterium]